MKNPKKLTHTSKNGFTHANAYNQREMFPKIEKIIKEKLASWPVSTLSLK